MLLVIPHFFTGAGHHRGTLCSWCLLLVWGLYIIGHSTCVTGGCSDLLPAVEASQGSLIVGDGPSRSQLLVRPY